MSVTIVDVAKKCGYSKATVSRAFISPEMVSERAKERVYAASKELNYTPNKIARALVRQHTENIAFIIHEKQYPTLLNPFYAPVLEAVMQETAKRGYSVFIATGSDMRLPNGDVYIKKHMDGVIFAGQTDVNTVEEFRRRSIPLVMLNHELELNDLVSVTVEHFRGAQLATEHLYERGHEKIGLLAGRFSKQVCEARLSGYMSVLAKHDLPVDTRFILDIDPSLEAAEEAMTGLLKMPDRPTAFFCTNDTIAAGAVKAAIRAGMRVPEDVAFVGFDDSIISRIIEPELTTIRIDAMSMGRIAVQLLFDLIEKRGLKETHIKVPASLVIRRTT